jgi:DNA-binding transcriptional LysR family regulator
MQCMPIKKIPLQQLDWDDLRVFLAIGQTGSIAAAAKRLRLDHSTVSRRLAQLELSLGGPLYERLHSGLRPTELAQRVQRFAESMDSAVVGLREAVGDQAHAASGSVRIAMMEGIGSMYIARRLGPLLARHPALTIQLVTSAQVVHVSRREADVFISFFKPEGRGLESRRAGIFTLGLYGAEAYFARAGKPATASDLPRHSFVGYIDDLIQVDAVRWLDEVTHPLAMAFQSSSMLAQMAAAASGAGLVLLPHFAVVKENTLQRVLASEISVTREIWINVHHDLRHSTRIRTVIDYLMQLFEADQPLLRGETV